MTVYFLWNNFSWSDKNGHFKGWMSSRANGINLTTINPSIDEHILINDRTESLIIIYSLY
jgi:hypothetical protein